jgi:iron complex outermembrane receptor protein
MSQTVISQSVSLILRARVLDAATNKPLAKVSCFISELNKTEITNSKGEFTSKLVSGYEYHLSLSHQGCETETHHLSIFSDTTMVFYLHHYHKHLNEVKIGAKRNPIIEAVSQGQIDVLAKENLSNLLEKTTGVRTIKNGNSIAKPIVQGLYGNRLTILNQGIAQTGQQWGNDHAPEIDPLAGNRIRVIKGVSALEYKGVNMGAVISIEANRFKDDPHLHGKLNSFFESNGLGFGANIQLEKNLPNLAWRLTGTYKNSGDKSTADYYLRNTGSREMNVSLLVEKTLFKDWKTNLFLSSFNTELGVLRGSHVSNTSDLNEALGRSQPFFTEDEYRRDIAPPRQEVNHHLWKLSSSKLFDSSSVLNLLYAGQINNRKEYDLRRGGRSEIPALFIFQHSHFVEGKWIKTYKNSITKSGVQFQYTENINQPETGISPLIPNYSSIEPSLFFTHSHNYENSKFDFGFRYDMQALNIFTTTKTIPRENIELSHLFHNGSASISYLFHLNKQTDIQFNTGFTIRNPAINELYSFGLHQGVASLEEGNSNLKSEKSFKTSVSIQSTWTERLFTEAQVYFQNMNDFIYLKPQSQYRLTIRGAYPVFIYEQTHAQIYGLDANLKYKLTEWMNLSADYSYLKGMNLSEDIPLIFMPANRLRGEMEFSAAKWGKWENPTWAISGQQTFRQNHLNNNQDFIPAPDAYLLLGSRISIERQIKSQRIMAYLQVENVLNTRYRDYLNRLRYFADDLGRNISMGVSITY